MLRKAVNTVAMRFPKALLFVVLAAVGCKKAAPPSCDQIAKGLDAVVQNQLKSSPMAASDHVKGIVLSSGERMKAVMATRCAQDKWSGEMIKCVAAATDNQSMSACKAKLSADQVQKLDEARKEMARAAALSREDLPLAPVSGAAGTPPPAGSGSSTVPVVAPPAGAAH